MGCKCHGKRGMGATAIEYSDSLPTSSVKLAGPVRQPGTVTSHRPISMGQIMHRRGLGSLGDDDPTDPIVAIVNAPNIPDTASIQTQYTGCLAGGGSFASCNQIPGVTPEMILAAKAKQIVSSPAAAVSDLFSDPKSLAIGAGILGGLYLLFRKKRGR